MKRNNCVKAQSSIQVMAAGSHRTMHGHPHQKHGRLQSFCRYGTFWIMATTLEPKGQLVSECLFGILNFPKKQRKIWQISAIETKKWSNQESKGTFLYVILLLHGLFNI